MALTKGKVYLLLQAAVCIALVVLLSLSAIAVYQDGSARKAEHPMESIYSPEVAAGKFAPIAPLFFAGVGLLIAGLVLGVKDERAARPVKDASLDRDLLSSRVARPSDAMLAERRAQRKLLWIGRGLFAVCMVPILIYILDPAHFPPDDPERMFVGLMRVLLPWTAVGLGALAVSSALRDRHALREVQAAQEQLKAERAEGIAAGRGPVDPPKKTGVLQAIVIATAVVLIIAGIFNGSARDVLYKAITICTECVGLG